jgi:serralysin
MTVWDGGGVDTYDFSKYWTDLSVDLRPGAWTTLSAGQVANLGLGHKAAGSIANALLDPNNPNDLGSLIDNAVGGSGNDTFYTNNVANRLSGLGGADHFVITGVNADESSDRITDYNQGNGGSYQLNEGDVIDLAALLSNTSGQPIGTLVRVIMDASGTFATLQVDRDGAANGTNWTAAVRLDGLQAGNRVQVTTDWSGQTTALTVLDRDGKLLPDKHKAVRDFYGDGTSDLLLQNENGATSVWLMNGGVRQGEIVIGNNGPTWHAVAVADFNNDDMADVVWQNDNGSTAVWLMNGTTKVGEANLQNNGPSWHAVAATDFNGDSKADILWQNDDGRATLWPWMA